MKMKKIIFLLLFPFIGIAQVQYGSGDSYITGQGSQTALNNNIILATAGTGSTDLLNGGKTISLHIVPAPGTVTAGNITFEESNDNFVSTANPLLLFDAAAPNSAPISTYAVVASTPRYFKGSTNFRYIRARISTGVTGTSTGLQCFTETSKVIFVPAASLIAQPTAANLNATVTATNLSTNIAQINGVTPLMGAGATGTGSPRVTIATDNLPTAAASADAFTNPTISQIGSDQMQFNGTSWDRARTALSLSTTTGDTGAKTATGNGATQTNVGSKGVQLFIVLGTVSGTTPTCVFKLQGSNDGGTNFYDIPGATTASLTASVNVGITIYPGIATTAGTTTTGTIATAPQVLPRTWRVVWTIGGTTPSFTITSITYHYTN
jgi:hypothetical protein